MENRFQDTSAHVRSYSLVWCGGRTLVASQLFPPITRTMAVGDDCMSGLHIDEAIQINGDSSQSVTNKHAQGEVIVLIPGLPNDLALQCLARVPRRHHLNLRCVCKEWRNMIASEYYYSLRKRLEVTEGWIYAFSRDYFECLHWHVLDPVTRLWKELPSMPVDCLRRYGVTCSVVQRELYVMGGGGGGNFHVPTPEVYKFDPVKNEWTEAAAMETARCYIVSGALNGRLYAVGGMGVTSSALRSWEVFNPQTNERLFREDPNVVPDLGESLVMDGKIYVRHASARSGYMGSYAAVFDPVESSWAAVDNEMVKKWCGPTAVTGNDVYMLDQSFGIKLMVLDKESGEWDRIGRFSPLSIRLPCRLAAIEKNLYVVGRGLKTLVLNTDKASTTSGGILVASTINGLPDSEDVILSCHVIEL
ncbi:F-box/kelch-repeat protein SKIP4 [Physcomitrium patens]|uniref:F-box domain-containing protein n=2 Tax=Physcomitrium patens TaxID=3218 RepID=A0A7I4A6U8_PHYPA|nr:F-box/kelch-repeat protein SKIP4-like [Physcomitrium patens]XP_024389254.1 F-box/kelch-repeat protein SKIP4-like [Physcomitrium patens]XP_024389255.1 F-box/kelch-repeat protein SKIP4-like [Physcomitrium patens]XP_024389256.1 F-box/kelch-repeat protein SKIP4-like [Physcomitrium patens]XP_024389257.1 F-box/kelch-repeat protein SKIP4-like [Physcomitrium patens]|eukprot:XP_024389253.1 F-box/kelch-repeat protein SKIP4-like [Physcomitrella patens]